MYFHEIGQSIGLNRRDLFLENIDLVSFIKYDCIVPHFKEEAIVFFFIYNDYINAIINELTHFEHIKV